MALRSVPYLALADLWHERVLAACSAGSLAAVLAPLLVLAGLHAGVVQGLRETILADPHAREIITVANRTMPLATLEAYRARAEVSFLAPRTRTLSATLLLEREDAPGEGTRVELIPSGPGDPLADPAPEASDQLVLSTAAAARLQVTAGMHIIGRLARITDGKREAVPLPLVVAGVAPPSSFPREAAFIDLRLAVAIEDFQDGLIPPPADTAALLPAHRDAYAGFRLYARRLEDVPGLDSALRAEGIDVVSRAGDVAALLRIDRNLGLLFAVVAGLGGGGYLVSLGAGLWANVERKRAGLALLRFLGLGTASLCAYPALQAAVLGVIGSAVAVAAAFGVAHLINDAFAGTMGLDRPLCLIGPRIAVVAAVLTVAGAVLVGTAAGLRAARVQAWEGVTGT
jgi:putative ABC transport system permease protein